MMTMMMNSTSSMMRMSSNTEEKLVADLLSEYSRYVRPVVNTSKILYIHYHLRLSRILKIDERNQILITAMWLEQNWVDEYLRWDPMDYDNITSIHVPSTLIWIPDTVLYNSADVDKEPGTDVMMTNAIISYNGSVFWQAPAIFKSSCKLEVSYFPFDQHRCNIKFGPWAYLGNEVVMKKVSDTGDFSQMSSNGQWELLDMPVEEHLVKYGCCPIPFSDIEFFIVLRRKALFYVFNLLFPSVFMSLISLLGFYLPPESGEKVGLNITILLSLVFFLLLNAQLLPPSDSISYLGLLLSIIIGIMSVETAISVVLLRMYHLRIRYPPPAWARSIILDKSARWLRLDRYHHEFDPNPTFDQGLNAEAIADPFEFDTKKATREGKLLGSSFLQKLELDADDYGMEKKGNDEDENEVGSAGIGSSIFRIGNYLRRLVNISRKDEARSSIQQQWIDLCMVLDRLLLILITLALVIFTLIILLLMAASPQNV
ncbi:neuronal acetylcholine receptor subunit alpha-10-like [Diadema antillarum]|uniref:neuronal acetylcholine receptor subunit alpha-10-like n=1 Tax=Diadema antillarum TaxID=105358 RepID=UPI003A88DF5C